MWLRDVLFVFLNILQDVIPEAFQKLFMYINDANLLWIIIILIIEEKNCNLSKRNLPKENVIYKMKIVSRRTIGKNIKYNYYIFNNFFVMAFYKSNIILIISI